MSEKQIYQVLARKYRPGKLGELIGQDMLVRTLTNAINSNRIPHAFILTGIRGVGKTSTARILARSLICIGKNGDLQKPTTEPCGVCEQCKAIAEDRHVDVLEMDAASRTGVGDIREIIDSIKYLPVNARYKIYIIDEVHMLSKSAFNALLKTLEEPPTHTKFIFATTEIRKIPITILSRCMRFDLARVGIDVLSNHLANIARQENITIDDDALAAISYAATGSVRDALSLLDQAIGNNTSAEKITRNHILEMIGITSRDKIFDLFDAVIEGNPAGVLNLFHEIHHGGVDPIILLQDFLELSHFITQMKILPDFGKSPHIAEGERIRGEELAKKLSLPFLARVWQMLLKGISEAQIAPNAQTAAEMILVRLTYASNLPTPGDLVKKISDDKNSATVSVASVIISDKIVVPSAVKKINPTNFKELSEIFKEKEEGFIHDWLQEIHPISFDAKTRRIEFCPAPTTPSDLAGKIGDLLTRWTGNRWVVAVSNKSENKSLKEEKTDSRQMRKQAASEDKAVKALLKAFEGASITNMEEISDDIEDIVNIMELSKTGENYEY